MKSKLKRRPVESKLKIIIPILLVVILAVVIVAVDPLHWDLLSSGNNSTNSNNHSSTNTTDEDGEQANPLGEGDIAVPITFGISPGKFYLHNGVRTFVITDSTTGLSTTYTMLGDGAYMAGRSREYQLMITNKNDHAANFSVDYRVPDNVVCYLNEGNVVESYTRPTSEVRDWVWISNKHPEILAHQTINVTIRLGMPTTATPPGARWEFWIGVIDQSQTSWLKVEIVTRWLVTMEME